MVRILKRVSARVATPPDPFLVTGRTQRRVRGLVDSSPEGSVIFNVGAGYTDYGPRVLNIDIFDSGTTHVIASALALPFADDTADLVILQGVLEHVEDAQRTLDECRRVLKPGGLFYTEMPFLQPYHESPIDMRRSKRSSPASTSGRPRRSPGSCGRRWRASSRAAGPPATRGLRACSAGSSSR